MLVFLCCGCKKKSSHKRRSVTLVSYNSKQSTSRKKLNPDLYGDPDYDYRVTEEDKKDSPFNRIYRSTMRHTFSKFKFRSTQKRNEAMEFYNLQLKPVSEVLNENYNLKGLYNDNSLADIAVVLNDDRKQENEETKMDHEDEVDERNVDVVGERSRDVENNRITFETKITKDENSRNDENNVRRDNVFKNTPESKSR